MAAGQGRGSEEGVGWELLELLQQLIKLMKRRLGKRRRLVMSRSNFIT